jgi:hypothetical protein
VPKRERHFDKVAEYKQRFSTLSTTEIRSRLNFGALAKEAGIALRELLQAREIGASETASVIQRAKAIAAQIVDGTLSPHEGAKLVCEIRWQSANESHALDGFVYWEDEYVSADTEDRQAYCHRAIMKVAQNLLEDKYPGGANWDKNAPDEVV